MDWCDITYDTVLKLDTGKYSESLFVTGFPFPYRRKIPAKGDFLMFKELTKRTLDGWRQMPKLILQSSPLPLADIELDQLEHCIEEIIFHWHFEEPLTKLVNGQPCEQFDLLAILIGAITFVQEFEAKRNKGAYSLEAICLPGQFEMIKELMEWMEICVNGEYIPRDVGSLVYGAIIAIQQTPGITSLDKPPYEFLLKCFNNFLGTNFVRVKGKGLRTLEAYGNAITFFKDCGL